MEKAVGERMMGDRERQSGGAGRRIRKNDRTDEELESMEEERKR